MALSLMIRQKVIANMKINWEMCSTQCQVTISSKTGTSRMEDCIIKVWQHSKMETGTKDNLKMGDLGVRAL